MEKINVVRAVTRKMPKLYYIECDVVKSQKREISGGARCDYGADEITADVAGARQRRGFAAPLMRKRGS